MKPTGEKSNVPYLCGAFFFAICSGCKVVVERSAPRSVVLLGKVVWVVAAEIVAIRAKMVVNKVD